MQSLQTTNTVVVASDTCETSFSFDYALINTDNNNTTTETGIIRLKFYLMNKYFSLGNPIENGVVDIRQSV